MYFPFLESLSPEYSFFYKQKLIRIVKASFYIEKKCSDNYNAKN